MGLRWLRALHRGLWGGPAAPELCRSLCQRPARVPSQGGDTAGTPTPGRPPRGDTSGGDPSAGDTSAGDTSAWHRRLRQIQNDPQHRERPRGTGRGDSTSGGDTSGGDTLGGDTSRGDTPRDHTSRGDTLGGDTPRGDTLGGDTPRDHTSGGDTLGGDTSGGATAGAPPKSPPRRLRRLRSAHGDPERDPERDPEPEPRGGPAAFEAALRELCRSPPGRGGRLALVEAALAAMEALGAERSRGAYHALLRLLPRGAWVPRGPVQRLLLPFPRQQECGLRLLEQMERHGVMPDAETRFLLLGVFGPRSRPVRKVQRMLYWLPRFRHLDPHRDPRPPPPGDPAEPPELVTARLGLHRMTGDPAATVTVLQRPVPTCGQDEGSEQHYLVSSQTPEQRELLAQHDPTRPVFVEGPFPLWLRGTLLKYFVLRGDPLPPALRDPPPDPERSFYFPLHLELDLERGPWDNEDFDVEEVPQGPVFALCVATSPDRRSLARWVSALQELNPVLGRAPVLFRLGDPPEHPRTPELGPGTPPAAALQPPEGRPGEEPPERGGE